jgi:hypothetical protein
VQVSPRAPDPPRPAWMLTDPYHPDALTNPWYGFLLRYALLDETSRPVLQMRDLTTEETTSDRGRVMTVNGSAEPANTCLQNPSFASNSAANLRQTTRQRASRSVNKSNRRQ